MADKKILISRTDSIGDVVLTLPMAGIIKQSIPNSKVYFLGRTYTKAVIELSEFVDEFINYDTLLQKSRNEQITILQSYHFDTILHVFPVKKIAFLAKWARITNRVGTRNRIYHWFSCNHLIKLSRKNSDLHEAQLNIKLLSFFGINTNYNIEQIPAYYRFTNVLPMANELFVNMLDKTKTRIIIHPKSKGSAREWGLENFSKLIQALPEEKYQIFISGNKEDSIALEEFCNNNPKAIDITGKLTLNEFISFINLCDVLVAASTGPLHIAAALGKKAIGLFAPMRPIHPGRWAPIGAKAQALVIEKNCNDCRKGGKCACIESIEVQKVVHLIEKQ